MNSQERNATIHTLDASLEDKAIPYMGWFWRDVDFTEPIWLAYSPNDKYVGFCENNKWDYPTFKLTHEEQKELIRLIDIWLADPTAPAHSIEITIHMMQCLAKHITDQQAQSTEYYG